MEVNEKNIQNPDFDSNLTGIWRTFEKIYLFLRNAVKILDSPPAGECIKTLEAFR
jgi:hypothetical protein